MKKIIVIIFALLPCFLSAQKVKTFDFIDYKNDTVTISTSSNNIFITFSESNCHNCYLLINELFRSIDFVEKGYKVNILATIDKESIKNIGFKRQISNSAINYFPNIKDIYFISNINKNKYRILDYKIKLKEMPSIFIISENKIYCFKESEIFDNYGLDQKFVEMIQQL